ncbi:hypothetical protein [Streptomyces sp. DH12]|nr:hypothetical protein [Streptomyces sp. DH12]
MVRVPRDHVLADLLAPLPAERRERLERSETRLVGYLDGRLGPEDPRPRS